MGVFVDEEAMGCDKGQDVLALVSGRLSRDRTLTVLDHTRECEECRSLMTEHARVHAAVGRGGEPVRPEPSCSAAVSPVKRYVPEDSSWRPEGYIRRGSRFGARRMVILGVVISGVVFASNLMRPKEADTKEPTWEEITIAAALEVGRPSIVEPKGLITTRPKVLAAILPAGSTRFTLNVTTAGARIYTHEFTTTETGATFDAVKLTSRDGKLPATEALVSFPDSKRLPLEPGTRYFMSLELPNGNESAATQFEYK